MIDSCQKLPRTVCLSCRPFFLQSCSYNFTPRHTQTTDFCLHGLFYYFLLEPNIHRPSFHTHTSYTFFPTHSRLICCRRYDGLEHSGFCDRFPIDHSLPITEHFFLLIFLLIPYYLLLRPQFTRSLSSVYTGGDSV